MTQIPIEERLALQDQMIAYCYAVDKLTDVEELLDLFTEDAVLDFSAIGLPAMNGGSCSKTGRSSGVDWEPVMVPSLSSWL